MEWYVYYYDANSKKISKYNIFKHGRFMEEVKVILAENDTKEDFAERLERSLNYYFLYKYEWEIKLSQLNDSSDGTKVDVADQVKSNWEQFVNYVWSFKTNKEYENNWITCKNGQMPEDLDTKERKVIDVLVTTSSGKVTKVQRIHKTFNGDYWCWGRILGECKAWMSLPKEYQEE